LKKKANLIVPFFVVFLILFIPFLSYQLDNVEKKKEKTIVSLQHKSLVLDEEYKEIKKLVEKYGIHKEFLNES